MGSSIRLSIFITPKGVQRRLMIRPEGTEHSHGNTRWVFGDYNIGPGHARMLTTGWAAERRAQGAAKATNAEAVPTLFKEALLISSTNKRKGGRAGRWVGRACMCVCVLFVRTRVRARANVCQSVRECVSASAWACACASASECARGRVHVCLTSRHFSGDPTFERYPHVLTL